MLLRAVLLQVLLIPTKTFTTETFEMGGVVECEMVGKSAGVCRCRPGALCTYVSDISGVKFANLQLD